MLCSVPCCEVEKIFFFGFPQEQVQLSKPSIRNKMVLKMVFCRIIGVIMLNLVQKITLKMLCSVPCCEVQQIFFSGFPKEQVHLSKPSIQNKLVLKMAFRTIIAVIMPNIFQKIALNVLCSVPCYEVQQIFFFWTLSCQKL